MSGFEDRQSGMPNRQTEATWFKWPGMPVYGATEGAQPPDLQRPWDFPVSGGKARPQPEQPAVSPQDQAPPQSQDAAPPQPAYQPVEIAPSQNAAPAQPSPQEFRPAPEPQYQPPRELDSTPPEYMPPPPYGPAMTPEDRARQIGLIPSGEQHPPAEQSREE